MTRYPRPTAALLLALMAAAALGRVDLGADTEASVLWSPAFQIALVPALALGWALAPRFGGAGARGWLLALGCMALVVLPAGIATALALGLGALDLLTPLPGQPLALGALAFGAVAVQVLALRRQSRK
ncbi:MAG: hypothetical protein RIT14_99 [Pseudomonadota bacterium]|jgi:hypothetical protein